MEKTAVACLMAGVRSSTCSASFSSLFRFTEYWYSCCEKADKELNNDNERQMTIELNFLSRGLYDLRGTKKKTPGDPVMNIISKAKCWYDKQGPAGAEGQISGQRPLVQVYFFIMIQLVQLQYGCRSVWRLVVHGPELRSPDNFLVGIRGTLHHHVRKK